jgi:hypothetical protein
VIKGSWEDEMFISWTNAVSKCETQLKFPSWMYRQGRADQNEADVKVVKGYTKEHPLSWQYTPSALVAAIRAPGPEVNDER